MDEIFAKHEESVLEYLKTKLPDCRIDTVLEIAAFVSCKTAVLVNNALQERDTQWSNIITKRDDRWYNEFREIRKSIRRRSNNDQA